MKKIVAKVSTQKFTNSSNGKLLPIFYTDWTSVDSNDFPNTGDIFVATGFERIEDQYFYEVKEESLRDNNRFTDSDPSQAKKIIYCNEDSLSRIELNRLIPIYDIDFNFKSKRVFSTKEITFTPFFLKQNDDIFGPFDLNGYELTPFRFKEYEEDEIGS